MADGFEALPCIVDFINMGAQTEGHDIRSFNFSGDGVEREGEVMFGNEGELFSADPSKEVVLLAEEVLLIINGKSQEGRLRGGRARCGLRLLLLLELLLELLLVPKFNPREILKLNHDSYPGGRMLDLLQENGINAKGSMAQSQMTPWSRK